MKTFDRLNLKMNHFDDNESALKGNLNDTPTQQDLDLESEKISPVAGEPL